MSEHVRAGGSKIHRIMACPGSLQAPDSPAGAAAAKGTTAHYVGERCLMTGCDPDHPSFTGPKVTVLGQVVDKAMVYGVSIYVDWARAVIQRCKDEGVEYHLYVERSVDWATLAPPEPMRGSADLILVIPAWGLMIVGDYKNGTEWVEVVGNKQTRYYAVGALVSLPREIVKHVRQVQMTIIQPNVPGIDESQAVRSETIEVGELLDFADEAMVAVQRGQRHDAPRAAGKHCKYCSLAATCPERANRNVVEAQSEFEVMTTSTPLPVTSIPIEQLAVMVRQAEDLVERAREWLKDAKGRLEADLLAGKEVPGWKMVPKRAERVWNDPMEVEIWASQQKLTTDDMFAPRELLSPAQMEKLVGKKNLPEALYSKVSSGYSLARLASPKDAVRLGAGDEFDVQP